jgi:hypothetical protein
MYLGMLHEGGLSKGEVHQVAAINPARLMGLQKFFSKGCHRTVRPGPGEGQHPALTGQQK